MEQGKRLKSVLKEFFGYDEFRPLQEEIIVEALAKKDVLAVLPTGAGKSLCFQIPSLINEGTTIVISPLIALMKDQVDVLSANGIPATFLNSSLSPDELRRRRNQILSGQIRILYLSPERIALTQLAEETKALSIDLIAVDEAHCISEWGHDFRPEYRHLAALRRDLPQVPMMALTATATERVRADIVSALGLDIQQPFIGSFDRKNLTYRIDDKQNGFKKILAFLESRRDQSGIIYCHSRSGVERLATKLQQHGIQALPYHAGLDRDVRSRHQDRFIRDECPVMCATIAFGMGIDKPNVRFVVHQDLPKNIESYYQETGRAGRDGLRSDCLLLYSVGDATKHRLFIDEKASAQEQTIAREQLEQMIHFSESDRCRRALLLEYFGETYPEASCDSCDNCLDPKATFDGSVPALKVLSCIYRVYQHSGFAVGLNHIVEILTGAKTEKLRRWGHDSLSTYNIGTEFGRSGWSHLIRQLIHHKLVQQDPNRFNTLHLTPQGTTFLREKPKLALIQPPQRPGSASPSLPASSDDFDPELFDRLRTERKRLASERGVPAYVIFSDVTLRHIARAYPTTTEDLLEIHGIGAAKLKDYGELILDCVREHQSQSPASEPAANSPSQRLPERISKLGITKRRPQAGAQDRFVGP